MDENILIVALPVFGVIVGYFVKYVLDKKTKFSSENSKIKREMYQKYVDVVLSFINNSVDQPGEVNPGRAEKLVDDMRTFHKTAVLYSSPKVINAYSDMMQYSYNNNGKINTACYMVLMTNVFKVMRKDIGLSNKGLRSGAIRLMRPLINDYDTKIMPNESVLLMSSKLALRQTQSNSLSDKGEEKNG